LPQRRPPARGLPGRGPGRHRHRQQPAGVCSHPASAATSAPRTSRGGHRHSRRRC